MTRQNRMLTTLLSVVRVLFPAAATVRCIAHVCALAIGIFAIALNGYAQLPEIVDGQTIRRECKKSGRNILRDEELACIERMAVRLPKLDPAKREQFGRHYDPQGYVRCLASGPVPRQWTLGCEYFILQRRPAPEYWPYPEAKRPNLPSPELDRYYRPGIDPKEYYDALCRNVAGEFILRTVDDVESIYQIRPRPEVNDDALFDRYVLEDPYGYAIGDLHTSIAFSFLGPNRYRFVETPNVVALSGIPNAGPYLRLSAPDLKSIKTDIQGIEKPVSEYGYTWRDFTSVRERGLGIAGGELLVVHLRTGEVMAFKRGFARSVSRTRLPGGVNWESTDNCPIVSVAVGASSKTPDFAYWFVKKILKPRN